MNDFLADCLTNDYKSVLGAKNENVGKVIKIFGQQAIDEFMFKKTFKKLKDAFAHIYKDNKTTENFIRKEANSLSKTQKPCVLKLLP